MHFPLSKIRIVAALVCASLPMAAAADCTSDLSNLDTAAQSMPAAQAAEAARQFAQDSTCNDTTRAAALRRVAALLAQRAQEQRVAGDTGFAQALLDAAPALHWLVKVTRADIAADQGAHAEAAVGYSAALDLMLDPGTTPDWDQVAVMAPRVAQLAQENTMLAGTLDGVITRGGSASGVFTALERGITFEQDGATAATQTSQPTPVVQAAFLPIRFDFDDDQLNTTARNEALRLVAYIKAKKITWLHLVGHTDDVGEAAYNQDLSERRARALADFIQASGVKAQIKLSGRGESEPPLFSDPALYTEAQRRTIARRVELVLRY